MASAEEYRRKADMHERYLRECRLKRKTNANYADMMVDVAADMAFCDRAVHNFDADPVKMGEALEVDIERFLERPNVATDIPAQQYAKALRQRVKAFKARAAEGAHLVP